MESGVVTGARSDIVQMQFLYMAAVQKSVWNVAEVAKFKNGQMRRAREVKERTTGFRAEICPILMVFAIYQRLRHQPRLVRFDEGFVQGSYDLSHNIVHLL
jgi:hypothetical protein